MVNRIDEPNADSIASALEHDMTPGERLLFKTSGVAIGHYHAATTDAWFRGGGPLELHYIAFSLTRAVEIRHRNLPPFVSTPATVSLLSPGDSYVRRAIAPEGEHAIYLALSKCTLQSFVEIAVPRILDQRGELSGLTGAVPVPPAAILSIHLLAADLSQGRVASPIEAEERVSQMVHHVLTSASNNLGYLRMNWSRSVIQQKRSVERAREYLAINFDRNITLDELSRVAETSPYHLARLFRKHTGFAVHEYLSRVRLGYALDLLSLRQGGLSEIAHQLGFTHHSHFGASFKRIFGLAPSAYQRKAVFDKKAMRHQLRRQGVVL